jgi:hypothetical protein
VRHAHSLLQHVNHESVRKVEVVEAVVEDALTVAFKPVIAARVWMNVELYVPGIGVDVENLDLHIEAVVLADGVLNHGPMVAVRAVADELAITSYRLAPLGGVERPRSSSAWRVMQRLYSAGWTSSGQSSN